MIDILVKISKDRIIFKTQIRPQWSFWNDGKRAKAARNDRGVDNQTADNGRSVTIPGRDG